MLFRGLLFLVAIESHIAATSAADDSQTFASLGEVLSNVSTVVGSTAQFYCEVIGTQALGEQLKFFKVDASTGMTTELSSDGVVVDGTKYMITDKYRLTIRSVTSADDGEYQCILGAKQPEVAYLVVLDPPTTASVYWGDGQTSTLVDVAANLTCEAGLSRPPATFRWYRGNTEITAISFNPSVSVDSNGYGRGMSSLELTPNMCEEDIVYTCHAFIPGVDSLVVETITVTLTGSGGHHVFASIYLILSALWGARSFNCF